MMNTQHKNLIAIHLAVLLFGVSGVFGKLLALPPMMIVLGRVFFAALFLLVLLFYLQKAIRLKQLKDYGILALLGLILALHWVTFFQSIQLSTVAVGLLTFSTFPVFATFLEPLFFKEPLKRSSIILAIITFFGVALVIPQFELGNQTTQGALWGIASGLTFAILSIMNRKYVQNYSSLVIAFYQSSWAMVVLLPFLPAFLSNTTHVIQGKDILLLVLLGVVFTALAHALFIRGLSSVKAQTAGIIASLEPVYGMLFALILVNEIPTLRVLAGGAIILGATLYATYQAGADKQ